jgi:hypothetical protein
MSHSGVDTLPASGTLCWCKKCGDLFRAYPNLDLCDKHRKPRARIVDGVITYLEQK